jgi:hypothetical protein
VASGLFNVLGCLYLERHNFDILTTNRIDGGVFVVSGRTMLVRAKIMCDPRFQQEFVTERFFFGKFGPLNADDDNFITRWVVRKGWDIYTHCGSDCIVETDVGEYPRFLSQCLRWVRTTWRSSTTSLFTDRTVWYRQPWCVYAVYLTSMVNFALFYDPAMIYTLWMSVLELEGGPVMMWKLVPMIFASKFVKTYPY